MKHFEYLKTLDFDKFLKAQVEWDVYKIPIDFKKQLLKYSPPLPKAEFEKEFNSDMKVKRYYYLYDDPDYKLPLHEEQESVASQSNSVIHEKLFKVIRKFRDNNTYDYYNQKEEIEEKEEAKLKKYDLWKDSDLSSDLFTPADDLKRRIKSKRNNSEATS